MKSVNDLLMDQAKTAIDRVVEDKSVKAEETIANLVALIEHLEILLDAIRSTNS